MKSMTSLSDRVEEPRKNPRSEIFQKMFRSLKRDRTSLAGVLVLLSLITLGVIAPFVIPVDPVAADLPNRFMPPAWINGGTWNNPLGTDSMGRDVLIRVIYGARTSLLIGGVAAVIAVLIGLPLGLLAGYAGGAVDSIIMRIVDIQLGFPSILLYISALTVIQPSLWTMILTLGIAGWVLHARLVRSLAISQSRMEYVQAAKTIGASSSRIVFHHVFPNVLAPVIVITSFSVATFIITASSLSFLGLGLPPSSPDWGIMISDGMTYIRRAWWPSTFAGIALSLTVFGVNVVGDWIRDFLDPRLRNL